MSDPRPMPSDRAQKAANAIQDWMRMHEPGDPGFGRELADLLDRCYMEERTLYDEVEQWLDRNPDAVRVREGGGPECLAMSFAVTIAKAGLAHITPTKNCQTGHADICAAADIDGVTCPDDSCDIDDGIVPHHSGCPSPEVCEVAGCHERLGCRIVNTPNVEEKSRCWHLPGNSPTNLNQVCAHQGKWHQVDSTGWTEISRERAAELINDAGYQRERERNGVKDDSWIKSSFPNRVHRIEPHLVASQIDHKVAKLKQQSRDHKIAAVHNRRDFEAHPERWANEPGTPEDVERTYGEFIRRELEYYSTVRVIERPDGDLRFILVYGDEDDNFVIHGTGPFSNFDIAQAWFLNGGR